MLILDKPKQSRDPLEELRSIDEEIRNRIANSTSLEETVIGEIVLSSRSALYNVNYSPINNPDIWSIKKNTTSEIVDSFYLTVRKAISELINYYSHVDNVPAPRCTEGVASRIGWVDKYLIKCQKPGNTTNTIYLPNTVLSKISAEGRKNLDYYTNRLCDSNNSPSQNLLCTL